MRPTKSEYYLDIAVAVSARATCPRLSVGAVMVKDNCIISTGYNGSAKSTPHCIDIGCEMVDIGGKESCVRALHAESNAIDRAPWAEMKGAHLYVTVTPCYECAKRIVSAGISRVAYASYYDSRNTNLAVDLLKRAGLSVHGPSK
ncbi:MAG: deoxycytidylate deaminase [Alphaproteobacteria bacterium]